MLYGVGSTQVLALNQTTTVSGKTYKYALYEVQSSGEYKGIYAKVSVDSAQTTVSPACASINRNIDKIPPTISGSISQTGVSESEAEVTITATDTGGSGVASITWSGTYTTISETRQTAPAP